VILKLKRTPGIFLVGFMGSGKSTAGRLLGERIGWRFVDIDEEIEASQDTTIAELFETRGEPEFRKIEYEAIRQRVRKIQVGQPMVVALGGGAFTVPETLDLVENNGVSIWLDLPFSIIRKRVGLSTHRPLARDPVKFQALYESRRELYAKADYRIELNEDDSRLAVERIMEIPLF
jgi:shikimate kinase